MPRHLGMDRHGAMPLAMTIVCSRENRLRFVAIHDPTDYSAGLRVTSRFTSIGSAFLSPPRVLKVKKAV